MIRVEDYHKSYRETVAVDGLSFEVAAGSIMGLVGPNGAGKTTTMRALAGIIRPTSGRLSIAGHDVVHDSIAAKRALAYVPDDPKLFDALTVWEHLEFIASAYRVDNFVSKGEALIEQFELVEKRGALAQELSRGMRQKVAICCAYLHEPEGHPFRRAADGPRPVRDPNAEGLDCGPSRIRRCGGRQLASSGACGRPLHPSADPRIKAGACFTDRLTRPDRSTRASRATGQSRRSRTFSSERLKRQRGRDGSPCIPPCTS